MVTGQFNLTTTERRDFCGEDVEVFSRRVIAELLARPAPLAGPVPTGAVVDVGHSVGRYRLRRRLGQGATGVVFEAQDERSGRAVAVKVPKPTTDPALRERFRRERRIATTVKHRNVVEVLEVVDGSAGAAMVMELVRGETLRHRVKKSAAQGARIPLHDVLKILRGVCRGLAVAHQSGIVHRDVKPENVMIDVDGQIKVLDFGIAMFSSPAARLAGPLDRLKITQPGAVLGTPSYMSPEQARAEPLDARTDVFSLGAMLYELLVGRKPFTGASALEVLLAVQYEQPDPMSEYCSGLGARFDAALTRVVMRCLEKDPGGRYADARALLEDLKVLTKLARLLVDPRRSAS